jgi:hypothetical protein
VLPAVCLSIWYPKVGNLAALCGGFTTMFVIYILPVFTHIAQKHSEIDNLHLTKAIRGDTDADEFLNSRISISKMEFEYGRESRRNTFTCAVFLGIISVLYGISVLVLQLIK